MSATLVARATSAAVDLSPMRARLPTHELMGSLKSETATPLHLEVAEMDWRAMETSSPTIRKFLTG